MRQFPQLNPKMKLTPRRLKVAGWLAVASSFLTLPWFLFTYPLADRHDLVFTAAKAGMMIGRLTLLIYLFLVFQQLLTKRYAFTGANVTISLLIQASIVHTSAVMLGLAAVSYTHLDVYKRQIPASPTSTLLLRPRSTWMWSRRSTSSTPMPALTANPLPRTSIPRSTSGK